MPAAKPMLRKLGLPLMLFLLSGLAWGDDVTVYEKAPSVEELQRQLLGDGDKKPRKVRTRAIIRVDEEALASHEAGQAESPAGAEPPQVSEKAVAFPINFRLNSAEVLPESVPFIESIAGLMQKDKSVRVLIEGHTDRSGSLARNTTLSRERAFSVMNYLVDHYRIDPTRLVPVGKGYSEPLSGLESTHPKNRRVQFRIIG